MQKLQDLDPREFILIKNARQNNLKNIDLAIPQKKLVVITGVSGSGKSSLAFDTLYAEGQRRYVESLSAYIRQFTGKINKPEVDYIKGLSPAIAIQQKVKTNNPRSTLGTTTEIYDYLKLLYARIGRTYSPVSEKEVKLHTVDNVLAYLKEQEEGMRVQILAPIITGPGRDLKKELSVILQKGFSRIAHKGKVYSIEDVISIFEADKSEAKLELAGLDIISKKFIQEAQLLIDRIVIKYEDRDNDSRIADSVQTAFFEGHGTCIIELNPSEDEPKQIEFSNRFEADGIEFEEPSANLFTFNNPFGACRSCEGFGMVIGIDEEKVIPDPSLSVYEDAVACWKGNKMSEWKDQLLKAASKANFPIHRPYNQLTADEKEALWKGTQYFDGIREFFRYIESKQYKIQYRVLLSRYKGKTKCPECEGTRLRKEASYVKINNVPITALVVKPVKDLHEFFDNLKLTKSEQDISRRILVEIKSRINFLLDVGLGYLTLNRASRTLSGGESQRIQLVTSLGSTLTGSMYILDEPSIGLHPRDTEKLITILQRLKKQENNVIVVEHDEDIMRAADYIIDIGPFAGRDGGKVIFEGDISSMENDPESLTGKYLTGELSIPLPAKRRDPDNFVEITGAHKYNLKHLDVRFPLEALTVVTGVSGSGKSTLVREIIHPALTQQAAGGSKSFSTLSGSFRQITQVEYVDQNPIGKSSRSNPVTYLKAFDPIRELYSNQRLAKIHGFTPAFFSFNVDGGRCDVCSGEGIITLEMQFMADISLLCEKCNGKRYKEEVLQVTHKDKNIYDVLEMTVDEAIEFFDEVPQITSNMMPLRQVGLGYLKLGQSSANLSGGEAQRIKLASFLSKSNSQNHILFIFDEPTTGLHFHDIHHLLAAFNALIEKGHTVMVIEHNLEVMKCADWLIDLGPEGGEEGGYLVFQGKPEEILKETSSYTAQYLRKKLKPEIATSDI
ncbi:MAG: excinuclease ABC subunit UvrA [Bacteroidia bacterium]